MHWKRIAGWSALIFLSANVIGFCSGLTMAHWEIYGATIQTAVDNARLVRRTAIFVVAALLYWRFALGVAKYRFAHVVAAFVGFQVLDVALSLATPPHTVEFYPPGLARAFAAALLGYGLAMLSLRRSPKPAPLDGTQ
ncbi:hypothetical protein [Tahibacter soli]|jgi:hypothetical protein|uniref:Uncharacterized protein n=1 Tax=Tahibacter soli TaxID=2983605 RepID=A0A9X4BFM7_9GAMM|nr:hypothetical protein [Tahibacter soli]MDC8011400.1 hypothetical protein [Tahibacter soli]